MLSGWFVGWLSFVYDCVINLVLFVRGCGWMCGCAVLLLSVVLSVRLCVDAVVGVVVGV